MSTEQNKSIVRRFVEEVWGRSQASLITQMVTRDLCDHNPLPGQPRGPEGQRWAVEMFQRAIPDMKFTIEHLVAEGDRVVDHWTASGTHKGDFLGIPATGKRFTITGSDMFRLTDGKIAEIWRVHDTLSMMRQLGVIPMPAQASQSAGRSTPSSGPSRSVGNRRLSDDEKRALIRRGYEEFIDKANPNAADTLLAPNFVGHFSGFPTINGHEEFKQFIGMWNKAFPTNHAKLEDILVEGEMAACRVTITGKHTGPLMDIAPTGKQIDVQSLSIFRFAGEQAAEQWANNHDLGMMQQLGVVPMPEEAVTPC